MSRYTTVEVDIDLNDFSDEDILEEMEHRGLSMVDVTINTELLVTIYHKRRNGKDYQTELDQLIYNGIGRIL